MKNIFSFIALVVIASCAGATTDDASGRGSNTPNMGTAIAVAPLDAGATCPTGGVEIKVGIDDNGNGTLDVDEVDATHVVCNGEKGSTGSTGLAGQNGTNGHNALIKTDDITTEGGCAQHGVKIRVGVDDNNNGTLDDAEVDQTRYVCDGKVQMCYEISGAADTQYNAFYPDTGETLVVSTVPHMEYPIFFQANNRGYAITRTQSYWMLASLNTNQWTRMYWQGTQAGVGGLGYGFDGCVAGDLPVIDGGGICSKWITGSGGATNIKLTLTPCP